MTRSDARSPCADEDTGSMKGSVRREKHMNITVYLGANEGKDPALREAVRALEKNNMGVEAYAIAAI